MQFTPAIASAILLFSTGILAAPVPQLAGEGAAANSILSGTDNAVGFGVENVLDNTAKVISGAKGGAAVPAVPKARRQLAGEGAAANSILSGTDNAVGYGVENVLDNTADLISGTKSGSTTGSTGSAPPAPAGPAPAKYRRQADKISNGIGAVGNAAGLGVVTDPVQQAGDSLDGSLTSAAANAGAQVASEEESIIEGTTAKIPKFRRQADKISNGVGAVGNAAGLGAVTDPVQQAGDSLDGSLTSAAANAGAQVASEEESIIEGTTAKIPK